MERGDYEHSTMQRTYTNRVSQQRYCSWFQKWFIVVLTLELNVEDEYDVSIRQLRALFTYWCHVCCLRFRRGNLVVDGRQMVFLVSVHGRGSLFDMYCLVHFSLVPVGFTGQYFGVLHGHCGPTMISYFCWFIQICMFFEYLAETSYSSSTIKLQSKLNYYKL